MSAGIKDGDPPPMSVGITDRDPLPVSADIEGGPLPENMEDMEPNSALSEEQFRQYKTQDQESPIDLETDQLLYRKSYDMIMEENRRRQEKYREKMKMDGSAWEAYKKKDAERQRARRARMTEQEKEAEKQRARERIKRYRARKKGGLDQQMPLPDALQHEIEQLTGMTLPAQMETLGSVMQEPRGISTSMRLEAAQEIPGSFGVDATDGATALWLHENREKLKEDAEQWAFLQRATQGRADKNSQNAPDSHNVLGDRKLQKVNKIAESLMSEAHGPKHAMGESIAQGPGMEEMMARSPNDESMLSDGSPLNLMKVFPGQEQGLQYSPRIHKGISTSKAAIRLRKFREKLREDPEKWEEYKKAEAERKRNKRPLMSEEQKNRDKAKNRERARLYRARLKMQHEDMHSQLSSVSDTSDPGAQDVGVFLPREEGKLGDSGEAGPFQMTFADLDPQVVPTRASGQPCSMGTQLPAPILMMSEPQERVGYRFKKQREILMENMYQLWKDGAFCDLAIKACNGLLQAHSVVLASTSLKCKELILSHSSQAAIEAGCLKIPPNELWVTASVRTMSEILHCLYGGVLQLSIETVADVMHAACELGLIHIHKACVAFKEAWSHRFGLEAMRQYPNVFSEKDLIVILGKVAGSSVAMETLPAESNDDEGSLQEDQEDDSENDEESGRKECTSEDPSFPRSERRTPKIVTSKRKRTREAYLVKKEISNLEENYKDESNSGNPSKRGTLRWVISLKDSTMVLASGNHGNQGTAAGTQIESYKSTQQSNFQLQDSQQEDGDGSGSNDNDESGTDNYSFMPPKGATGNFENATRQFAQCAVESDTTRCSPNDPALLMDCTAIKTEPPDYVEWP